MIDTIKIMEELKKYPMASPKDDILYTITKEVSDIQTEVIPHVKWMKIIMDGMKGAGLAAPQVGISSRFFISRIEGFDLVINPKILSKSGKNVSKQEGCLTWPDRTTFVARADEIEVEWTNKDGEVKKSKLNGLGARIFQHEYDHLFGVCIFPRN